MGSNGRAKLGVSSHSSSYRSLNCLWNNYWNTVTVEGRGKQPPVPACLWSRGLIECQISEVSRRKLLTFFSPSTKIPHSTYWGAPREISGRKMTLKKNLHPLQATTPHSIEQVWHWHGSSPITPVPFHLFSWGFPPLNFNWTSKSFSVP